MIWCIFIYNYVFWCEWRPLLSVVLWSSMPHKHTCIHRCVIHTVSYSYITLWLLSPAQQCAKSHVFYNLRKNSEASVRASAVIFSAALRGIIFCFVEVRVDINFSLGYPRLYYSCVTATPRARKLLQANSTFIFRRWMYESHLSQPLHPPALTRTSMWLSFVMWAPASGRSPSLACRHSKLICSRRGKGKVSYG